MYKSFEDYLQTKHAEQYHGLDDDMPDDYNSWLEYMGVEEIIEYGQKYGELIKKEYGNK